MEWTDETCPGIKWETDEIRKSGWGTIYNGISSSFEFKEGECAYCPEAPDNRLVLYPLGLSNWDRIGNQPLYTDE
jgi:hypothetical protein